jgi:hypothetical protein
MFAANISVLQSVLYMDIYIYIYALIKAPGVYNIMHGQIDSYVPAQLHPYLDVDMMQKVAEEVPAYSIMLAQPQVH